MSVTSLSDRACCASAYSSTVGVAAMEWHQIFSPEPMTCTACSAVSVNIAMLFSHSEGQPDAVTRFCQQSRRRLVAFRACDIEAKVEQHCRIDPRLADIVAITHPRDCFAFDRAAMLNKGLDIRQQLAGVVVVRQAIDDRDLRIFREAHNLIMAKRPNHHHIDHTGDHSRRVFHRLAATQLRIVWGKKDSVAAKLRHARFKAHPRARRGPPPPPV